MLQVLDSLNIRFAIERLIDEAKRKIILVTPYLKLSDSIFESLKRANDRGVQITLIYGKTSLSTQEQHKLDSLPLLNIYFLKNLHSKIYLNEESLIQTSMNLHSFSEENNFETGILISLNENEPTTEYVEHFTSMLSQVDSYFYNSTLKRKSFEEFQYENNCFSQDFAEYFNTYYRTNKFLTTLESSGQLLVKILGHRINSAVEAHKVFLDCISIRYNGKRLEIKVCEDFSLAASLKSLVEELDFDSDIVRYFYNGHSTITIYSGEMNKKEILESSNEEYFKYFINHLNFILPKIRSLVNNQRRTPEMNRFSLA